MSTSMKDINNEDLIGLMRACAKEDGEFCCQCPLMEAPDCSGALLTEAADRYERTLSGLNAMVENLTGIEAQTNRQRREVM